MEQILHDLAALFLKAIPTVLLVILLYFYLRAMLFKPLEKVLKQRDELTEGARRTAEQSLAAAERKEQEYQDKLREARAEVYRAQEETRRKWLEDQAAQVAQARERAEAMVRTAKEQIAAEAAAAREGLAHTSAELAEEIATVVLGPRVGSAA
jgi:F-type H+-transporting ATPase subunit b